MLIWGWRRFVVIQVHTRKAPFGLPIPEGLRLRFYFSCALLRGFVRICDGCVVKINSEDTAGGRDERDLAEGGRECGEEFLGKLDVR